MGYWQSHPHRSRNSLHIHSRHSSRSKHGRSDPYWIIRLLRDWNYCSNNRSRNLHRSLGLDKLVDGKVSPFFFQLLTRGLSLQSLPCNLLDGSLLFFRRKILDIDGGAARTLVTH